jgi:glycosyltransferase involved in cell wall biosynthesis
VPAIAGPNLSSGTRVWQPAADMSTITVAIPTLNGAGVLEQTLSAVSSQRLEAPMELELLVCDSESHDGSVAVARRYGAEVIQIRPEEFSHGATRNLLMERSSGERVAFLTQDSVPAGERWLAELLAGFDLADDVALTFGPYRPRPEASVMVARELTEWFQSFSSDGEPRLDRLAPWERDIAPIELLGPRGFFTDANGCVVRAAWQSIPFRPVPYAEDHVLAHDMLRAGYAKAYLPRAAVIHSHDYSAWDWLRRSFDEYRALSEIYGFVPPLDLRWPALQVWGLVGADWRWARHGVPAESRRMAASGTVVRSLPHRSLRTAGALLGARADRLPSGLVRRLSLDGIDRGSRAATASGCGRRWRTKSR